MNCTEEERYARLGHKTGVSVYWIHYRNEVSTVDFQAIAHKTNLEDVSMLSSISLDRRRDAPETPSAEGFHQVGKATEVIELQNRRSELLDTILTRYGSLKNAQQVDASLSTGYHRVWMDLRDTKARLHRAASEKESRGHFQTVCPTDSDEARDDVDVETLFAQVDETGPQIRSESVDPRRHPMLVKHLQTLASLVDQVQTALFDNDNLTETQIGNIMVDAFCRVHSADSFYPGQEPFPGEYDCRWCGALLSEFSSR